MGFFRFPHFGSELRFVRSKELAFRRCVAFLIAVAVAILEFCYVIRALSVFLLLIRALSVVLLFILFVFIFVFILVRRALPL